ncbi:TetR/AcrR family transcriptional regulator [Falsirhodobacter algicola]|uniref:TetR family transcriptional regulator n=1 Tax=Falsirhodobacter algicola TaxID=2692330 RepID=A0A8J8SMC1_9RHOB|nr:TetR/AcrR family transcriptional regulator [Falsirhodobacter algicola]QUS37332.1 TetR family transcriptional regulator [Falsirhodobacter algicola]
MTRADLKPRKPGRPEGQTNLSSDILDVAEVMFAEQGFAGTTLRQVADRLGVNPAMIAYYFQNKDNLFRSVFTRRGHAISAGRMERLAALAGRPYGVEDLVRAFIEPAAELYDDVQGRAFLKLHARLHMEPEELSFELRRVVHNESTHAYAAAFVRLLGLPEREVYQRMSLLIGAYLYAFSGTSRLGELMGDDTDPMKGLLPATIAFGTAGMVAGITPS